MDGTALWKATRAFTISDIDGSDSNNRAWLFVAYGVSALSLDAEDLTVIIECNTGQGITDSSKKLVNVAYTLNAKRRRSVFQVAISFEVCFWPGKNKGDRQRHG